MGNSVRQRSRHSKKEEMEISLHSRTRIFGMIAERPKHAHTYVLRNCARFINTSCETAHAGETKCEHAELCNAFAHSHTHTQLKRTGINIRSQRFNQLPQLNEYNCVCLEFFSRQYISFLLASVRSFVDIFTPSFYRN